MIAQADGGFNDNGETTLAPDKEPGDIKPSGVLASCRSGMDHGGIGEDGFQPRYMVTGDSILDTTSPAGIGGNVSSNGGNLATGRIGNVPETLFGDHLGEIPIEYSCFYRRRPANRVNFPLSN